MALVGILSLMSTVVRCDSKDETKEAFTSPSRDSRGQSELDCTGTKLEVGGEGERGGGGLLH